MDFRVQKKKKFFFCTLKKMFLHRRVTPVTERWRAGLSREGHGNMMKTGVSWPAQQDVPEHIAHWRRPMLYLGVCLGATPRRA